MPVGVERAKMLVAYSIEQVVKFDFRMPDFVER